MSQIKLKQPRQMCPIRLEKTDYAKLRIRCKEKGINFQKLVEILVLNFLKGNKDLDRMIEAYMKTHKLRRKENSLDELEMNNLLAYIEQNESPLGHFNLPSISKEIEEEIQKEEDKDDL